MNHDINSPSAGPGSPSNEGRDEMTKCVLGVKDSFGAITAKVLIESFGVRKLADLPEQHYATAAKVSRDMILSTMISEGGDYETVLYRHVVEYAHVWKNVDMSLTYHVQRFAERMAIERPHPAMLPKLSPNDVIACLLEIAFKAQTVMSTTDIAHGYAAGDPAAYKELADALAPLNALPYNVGQGDKDSGALRAKYALESFLTGASKVQHMVRGDDGVNRPDGDPLRLDALGGLTVAPIIARTLAADLEYPAKWDTVAYPTLGEALIEALHAELCEPPPNDGWVIAHQTVVEMPDGKKELGYTLLDGLGVFTDEADASKSLGELNLPLGWVYMKVEQLIPGYIMPLLEQTAGLEQPVNEVFAVRSYDDTYVHSLIDAVADISTDGARFRVLMWLMEFNKTWEERPVGEPTPEEIEHFANFHRAEAVMNACEPTTLDEMRAALDAVSLLGIVPDMPSHYFSMAGAYDTLNDKAVELARGVLATYVDFLKPICKYCGGHVPGDNTDTLSEEHKADCVVTKARQLIEDQS